MGTTAARGRHTEFVDVAGKKTQLTIGGEGPDLLYLHSAAGETEWTPFHKRLSREFRVHLPAHPGFALSEGLSEIEHIQDVAWHYVDLLDKLEIERVPIVGFSLGAWIALELAVLRPERISRMVLAAAAGVRVEEAPMAELFIDDFDELRKLVFHDPGAAVADEIMPASLDDPRILNWLRAREATARVGWNPYLHDPRLPQHLRRIPCPTLLLWGDDDRLIPPAHGQFYAEHLPDARLEIFSDCGHMLPFEQPDKFVERVTQFLSG